MKILLTVGDSYSGYRGIHQLLLKAGLAEAMPALRDGMSADALCDKLVAANELGKGKGSPSQCRPGRLWENQLGDLLMANLEQPCWGWANANAIHLLEWLASFDPQFCFVLNYCSPVRAIGRKLKGRQSAPEEIAAAIDDWLNQNGDLLRFYFRHRERCVLVNSERAKHGQQELLHKINTTFDLGLNIDCESDFAIEEHEEMTTLLARELLADRESVHLLFQELESSADLGGESGSESPPVAEQAWAEYVALLSERAVLSGAVQTTNEQLSEILAEQQLSSVALAERDSEVLQLVSELDNIRNLLEERQQQLAGLLLDNERLAVQVGREREAFDAERLLRQQFEGALAQSTEALENLDRMLTDVRNGAAEEIALLQREIDETRRENASLGEELAANVSLQSRLLDLQVELDSAVAARKTLEQYLEELAGEKSSVELQLREAVLRLNAMEQDLGLLADEKIRLEKQHLEDAGQLEIAAKNALMLDELGKERDLLLQQLHQVQEELERCFLAGRAVEQDLQELKKDKLKTDQQLSDANASLAAAGEQLDLLVKAKQLLEQQAQDSSLAAASLQKQLDQLAQEKDLLAKHVDEQRQRLEAAAQQNRKLAEVSKENETLLLQLHAVQEELERNFQAGKAMELRLENLTRDRNDAGKQLGEARTALEASAKEVDLLVKAKQLLEQQAQDSSLAAASLQKQLDQLAQEKDLLAKQVDEQRQRLEAAAQQNRKLAEVGKENETLLLQLHAVQEELERNFLAGKAMELRLENLTRDRNNVGKQLSEARTALETSAKQLEQALKARQAAEKQVKDSIAQAAELKKQLDGLSREKDARDKLASDLKKQLAEADTARQVAEQLSKERTAQAEVLRKQVEQENRGPAKKQQESERRVAELTRENDLLLVQLHQVQEELEHYFLMFQENRAGNGAAGRTMALDSALLREIVFDMRKDIEGDNWYHAEADGRWAGPGMQSTIMLPILPAGEYRLEFDVVDAMTPDILLGTEVLLNGISLHAECDWVGYPAVLRCTFSNRGAAAHDRPELALRFPYLVSPAESGSDDERLLAVRLRSIRCERLDQN